jgi:hypothetical protein
MKKKVYSLCEAVADIAFIAGRKDYYSGDSRQNIANFILWAKEFEQIYKDVEWGVNSNEEYIDAIQNFAESKMNA